MVLGAAVEPQSLALQCAIQDEQGRRREGDGQQGMVCDGQRSQQTIRMVTGVGWGGEIDLWDPVPGTVPNSGNEREVKGHAGALPHIRQPPLGLEHAQRDASSPRISVSGRSGA